MHLKYEVPEEKLASQLGAMFGTSGGDTLLEVNPGGVMLPPKYRDLGQRILDLEVRPDDVWAIAYPRTGSTWTLEMIWCILNDLDFETARSTLINFRSPIIELSALLSQGKEASLLPDTVAMVEAMRSPRCVRSHLPLQLLPSQLTTVKPKIVYVARNPKDVCVSYYHYCRLLHNLSCQFNDFCELFLQGRAPVGPYLDHVLGFWKMRDEPNVLFLTYEGMKQDHRAAVTQIAQFLGKPLTDDQICRLIDHASFSKMRENPSVNLEPIMETLHGKDYKVQEEIKFIRKGQVGDWKNHMSEEMSHRFDQWMEEKLKGTGLSFQTN